MRRKKSNFRLRLVMWLFLIISKRRRICRSHSKDTLYWWMCYSRLGEPKLR